MGKEFCLQCRRHGFDLWVGKIPWRKAWQPIPVFFPGEYHGQRSLMDYSTQGCKELAMTEVTEYTHTFILESFLQLVINTPVMETA